MPYPRYSGNSGGGRGYSSDNISPWQSGSGGDGLLPTPRGGSSSGGGGHGDLNPVANILGTLLGGSPGGSTLASLAGQLAVAQAAVMNPPSGSKMMGSSSSSYHQSAPYSRDREYRGYRRGERSPPRSSRGYRGSGRNVRRSRSRSPRPRDRRASNSRGGGSGGGGGAGARRPLSSRPNKPSHTNATSSSSSSSASGAKGGGGGATSGAAGASREDDRERAEFEIYIGNYPKSFKENDLKNLFKENQIDVGTVRMKSDGVKAFAFAETKSADEIKKAVKAMDSIEIRGRRLRVRAAGDKDPKPDQGDAKGKSSDGKPAEKIDTSHVWKHLVHSFNLFLGDQMETGTLSDESKDKLTTVQTHLKEVFELPEDDTLKISRSLDMIFMQNNRREIPKKRKDLPKDKKAGVTTPKETANNPTDPSATEDEKKRKAADSKEENGEGAENHEEDDEDDSGNWKRRKTGKQDQEEDDPMESEPEKEPVDVAAIPAEDRANEKVVQEEDAMDQDAREEPQTANGEPEPEKEEKKEVAQEDEPEPKEESVPEAVEENEEAEVEEEEHENEKGEDENENAAEEDGDAEGDEIEAEAVPAAPKTTPKPARGGGRGGSRGRRSRGRRST
ncbi:hypothetical protein TCAL_01563 [Tigriopus californicus]|uniref:RRM domain-containing protein n=1 Tax=Tigriopus californicus TaxID=6832 RepID=A0A553P6Q7_TIGCA|nr:troponin T, skeletal muscle-like [Tigriopus californicus]TRY73366.1 hypothetical protein TCAL_01563 [Tigriopus californicus]